MLPLRATSSAAVSFESTATISMLGLIVAKLMISLKASSKEASEETDVDNLSSGDCGICKIRVPIPYKTSWKKHAPDNLGPENIGNIWRKNHTKSQTPVFLHTVLQTLSLKPQKRHAYRSPNNYQQYSLFPCDP